MVRDLSKELGKKVHFDIRGYNTDVDREILEKLESPLTHLLRNALDHGLEPPELRQRAGKPETGRLMLEAHHNAGMLVITVSDDGRGIDLDRLRMKVIERRLATAEMVAVMSETELLDFLFLPGFSTADNVTEISGRGVGLDVVHSIIQSLGGNIRLSSQKGAGTRFSLYLPITLSVIRAVLVRIAGEYYAFPHHRIERLIRIPREALSSLEDRQYFDADGRNVGVVLAHQLLELRHTEGLNPEVNIVLLNHMDEDYGVIVDSFCGEQDLVVRTLDSRLGKVRGISSSAILDDGSPILIVDVDDLRRSIEKLLQGGTVHRVDRKDGVHVKGKKRVLVVDDSLTVREVQRQILSNNGYEVETAVDGVDGWNVVRERPFDLVVSDIDMPRMNGLEFVRLIKSHPRLSTVPVVIVSYKDRKEDRLRGLEVGANHYLTKSSFHDNTYLDAVRDLIGAPG
jgi:two-component system sensor histidine kinase and response regulator WspE